MATFSTEKTIEGPFTTSTPIDDLIDFYLANGYRPVYDATAPSEGTDQTPLGEPHDQPIEAPDEQPFELPDPEATDAVTLEVARGRESAGWWSSDMTRLPVRVQALRRDGEIQLRYEVDTTGQVLTEEDRDFWTDELRAAMRYLRNPARRPPDLRHEEAKRAEQIRRRMLSYGIWGAIIAFLFVLLVNRFVTTV
jgi:hypothetical protein